jgi:hypothetical protein
MEKRAWKERLFKNITCMKAMLAFTEFSKTKWILKYNMTTSKSLPLLCWVL